MKLLLPRVLLIGLLSIKFVLACQNNCCDATNCTTCCQKVVCCQTCTTQCCKTNCANLEDNCQQFDCNSTTDIPTVTPVQLVLSSTTVKTVDTSMRSPVINTFSPNTTNNNTVTSNIDINNTIVVENRISIPINVSNVNKNVIEILFEPNQSGTVITEVPVAPTFSMVPSPTSSVIDYETTTKFNNIDDEFTTGNPPETTTIYNATRVPVLIPVPMEIPVPVTLPPRCCVVMVPCLAQPCDNFRTVCSEQCTHQFMYAPANPCIGGCYRRRFSFFRNCPQFSHCQYGFKDCSQCNDNFYESYGSYHECSGCFY